jgi:pimeloyl-ACP methyl ester carboxylesterase
MTLAEINGVRVAWQMTGDTGDAVVLVHGSWVDHHNWDLVLPQLATSFRVLTYDRRGHGASERPPAQGSVREDVADLAALLRQLDLAPAHVVGNSFGAAIALRLAGECPELFRTLSVHEPPVFGLLADVPEAGAALAEVGRRVAAVLGLLERGEDEAGARLFVETLAFGPGAWEQLPVDVRRTFVANAPTFLDENREPDASSLDLASLGSFPHPALVTHGTASPPFFHAVVARIAAALPHAARSAFEGAGHVPHVSHPREFVDTLRRFLG